MVSSTPMMVMTTSNSIRVKPAARGLPLMVRNSVQSLALRQRVHIEDVVAGLRIRRWTLVRAQSPGIRRCDRAVGEERITRHASQKINHDLFFALNVLDPVNQRLEVRRVARVAQL